MSAGRATSFAAWMVIVSMVSAGATSAQVSRRESRLAGVGTLEFWGQAYSMSTGYSVALSADGRTALVGGVGDGAARVFGRIGQGWSRQADIPAPDDLAGPCRGYVVGVSSDGTTAIVGCPWADGEIGAAWVYTRNGTAWTRQGPKLVGTGGVGTPRQGYAVALSADGDTAIVGGPYDGGEPNGSGGSGAAWIYTRSGGAWTQQGEKLVGNGGAGWAGQGFSVALSADGTTAIVGGVFDDHDWDTGCTGAAWVFTRSDGVWTQQGGKLVGSGSGNYYRPFQGTSVALSADGNTALVGGPYDFDGSNSVGATWVFTRSGGVWAQQGPKLVGSGASGELVLQGTSVALSADGSTALVAGPRDDSDVGASWVFTRAAGLWSQQGDKVVGGGATAGSRQGVSVAMAADAAAFIVGAPFDGAAGAAWVFRKSLSSWVPVVAHAPGAHDTRWRSDLGLLNAGAGEAAVQLRFFGPDDPVTSTANVPATTQSILKDVVGQLGASGRGALEIVADQHVRVTARTYHQADADADCHPDGTQGQDYPVLSGDDGLGAGESAYLPGLTESGGARSNIGLLNTGEQTATVLVELFDGAGTRLAEYPVTLAHGQWQQTNRPFETVAGQAAVERGFARVTVQAGSGVYAFASVVDNITNDPTTIVMQR